MGLLLVVGEGRRTGYDGDFAVESAHGECTVLGCALSELRSMGYTSSLFSGRKVVVATSLADVVARRT